MKRFAPLFVVLLLLLVVGCRNKDPYGTTPVSGHVKVDGVPMEGIRVTFCPASGDGMSAIGTTDAKGNFRLSTAGAPHHSGAVPGDYIPTFQKYETEEFDAASLEEKLKKYGDRPPKRTFLIPRKYSNVETCGFEPVSIDKHKKNNFEFEISTK